MILLKNSKKLHVFLFVLVFLSMRVIADETEIDPFIKIQSDMTNNFVEVNGKVDSLEKESESLKKNVESLSNSIGELREEFNAIGKKNDQMPVLILVFIALLMILVSVSNIVLLIEIKKTKVIKKQDARSETPKTEEIRATPGEEPSYGSSGEKNVSHATALAPGISSYSPISVQTKEPPLPVDETPLLYHSKEQRERRRAGAGDVYLDVNATVYERFSQGGRVSLSFEKSSNYLASPLALVDDNLLYVNFHRFNESLEIPEDMCPMMAHIYTISRGLPGFVERCVPAKVVFKDGKYEVAAKGKLYIEAESL